MQTIVINSQKGGSGKTMLCKHLAVEAERAGDGPVFLIDTDPQGTLTAWHAKREAETPARVELPFDGLEKGLELIRDHGAHYCIIDTASGRLDIAAELFKLANLVIFPVQPSEDDLTAAPVTVQNLKGSGRSLCLRPDARQTTYAHHRPGRSDPFEAWTGGRDLRRRSHRLQIALR